MSVHSLCPGLINTGLGRYNDTPEKKAQAEAMYANAAKSGEHGQACQGGREAVVFARHAQHMSWACQRIFTSMYVKR